MRILEADKLNQLATELVQQGYRVIAPVMDGKMARLKEWAPGQVIELDAYTCNSVKDFLLPHSEVIGRYKLEGSDFTPLDVPVESVKTVLLCVRPCDAAALEFLDTVFNWDYEDVFYNTRRKECWVVSLACTSADHACLCTSVRHAPDGTNGSDVMLFRADGGTKLIFREVTEKGRSLAAALGEVLREGEAAADPVADVPVRFDAQAVTDWLATNFDSPLWRELSLPCLGCGACAYACASCHCFDIHDEATRKESVRYRNWDNCGLALFTQHTSGHNPRPDRLSRRRQRVMHKFSYIPQRFHMLGCAGCGRCVRLCPQGVSMSEACERIDEVCKSKPAPR
jgi:sulfhydrogenase subunit beta (sulfur reductase)